MNPENRSRPDLVLDTRGHSCPLPVIEATRAASMLPRGALLRLISDCPGAHADLQAWAGQTGRELLEVTAHAEGGHVYLVRNGECWPASTVLDMRGRACPAPVVEAERTLNGMADGEVLKLLGDCGGLADEVGTWTRATGRQLLGIVPGPNGSTASYIQG
jgi:tRNA 2-thiouridine synthesizing protein A